MSRPVYVRVKDPDTKHEWDEPESSPLITKGRVQVIKGDRYPPSPVSRPPKRHLPPPRGKVQPTPAGEGTTNEHDPTKE